MLYLKIEDGMTTNHFGTKFYHFNNKFHREDGPAVEYVSGDKYWFLDGEQLDCETQEEFEQYKRLKAFW